MIGEVAIPPARKLEDLIRFVYLTCIDKTAVQDFI